MAVGQAEAMAALLATIKTIVQSVQSIIGYMTLPETRMRAIYAIIYASMRFCFPQVQQAWVMVQPIAQELVHMYDAYFVYRQACIHVQESSLPEAKKRLETELAVLRTMIKRLETDASTVRLERDAHVEMVASLKKQVQGLEGDLAHQIALASEKEYQVTRAYAESAQLRQQNYQLGLVNASLTEQHLQLDRAHKAMVDMLRKEKEERARAASDFESILDAKTREFERSMEAERQALSRYHEQTIAQIQANNEKELSLRDKEIATRDANIVAKQATVTHLEQRLADRNREIERLNASLAQQIELVAASRRQLTAAQASSRRIDPPIVPTEEKKRRSPSRKVSTRRSYSREKSKTRAPEKKRATSRLPCCVQ